jgi:hypothetical protein
VEPEAWVSGEGSETLIALGGSLDATLADKKIEVSALLRDTRGETDGVACGGLLPTVGVLDTPERPEDTEGAASASLVAVE